MMLIRLIVAAIVIGGSFSSARGDAPTWGDLSVRFQYDGEAVQKPLDISPKYGIDDVVVDESLIVNPANQGLANVVAYLMPPKGEEVMAHPSYEQTAEDRVKIEMREGRFEPHVLLLRTSQTMVQVNDDSLGYAPHMMLIANSPM
ncbi:MAG: hypothetical protein ACR2NZ_10080 [Rubripirellula sp.]